MKRSIFILVGMSLFAHIGFTQTLTQTIRGTIRDKESQELLPGISVVILHSNPQIGVISDVNGNFRLENIPVGRVSLKAFGLGYEEIIIPELLLGSGKELILSVELNEKFIKTGEAEIVADRNIVNNEMATVSARSFSVEETKRYAASVNDPARMALSYAGVANNGDFDNGIVIRGNSPKGLLWRMEGMEIPNPNHFGQDGASGGSISMLSANMLSNSDFFVGAFPAEYGNASSGVFDIKLRNGNDEKREYSFQFGVLGADLALEGPIQKNKSSYLVNYRYSTLAILDGVGIKIAGDAVPIFQDLSWKVNMRTTKAGTFSFYGLGGKNEVADTDTTYSFTNAQEMLTTGLSHLYLFKNNKTYLRTTVSYSYNLGDNYEEDVDSAKNYFLNYTNNNKNESYRVAFTLNHKFNAAHSLRAGVINNYLDFNLFSRAYDAPAKQLDTLYLQSGSSAYYQAFVQTKYKVNEQLSFIPGLHYLYFALNGSQSLEPRLGMQYDLNTRSVFTAGIGLHSRLEYIANYFAWVPRGDGTFYQANKNIKSTRAMHYIAGYKYVINEFLNFKSEVYYQRLFDVPVGLDSASIYSSINFDNGGGVDERMGNAGTGTNYGIELTLERPLKNNFYFLMTASLFNSEYETADGRIFNTRYNTKYLANVLIGKEYQLRKNNLFGLNLRVIYAGGLMNTPIDLTQSIAKGYAVYQEDKAYSVQNPDYLRPDLRVNYKINREKVSHEISLDIQNFINRANVYGTFYDADKKQVETAYQLGLIPVLNYRIEF